MVPDPSKACVGLEFFCFAEDELWETDDQELVKLGMRELEQLGLASPDRLGIRLRRARAEGLPDVRPRLLGARPHDPLLARRPRQLHPGRPQRAAPVQQLRPLLAALRAVDNLVKGTDHDIWAVNAESAYHEESTQDEQQPYIEAPETESMKETLRLPVDGNALALALGAAFLRGLEHRARRRARPGRCDRRAARVGRTAAGAVRAVVQGRVRRRRPVHGGVGGPWSSPISLCLPLPLPRGIGVGRVPGRARCGAGADLGRGRAGAGARGGMDCRRGRSRRVRRSRPRSRVRRVCVG